MPLPAPAETATAHTEWDVLGSALELIGRTPVVELARLSAGLPGRVLLKLEGRNVGGSAKDRAALSIVRRAEASGELEPGGTIVESTSGNTGIGLALVGRLTGHPVVIVHAATMSAEKKAQLNAYGARLVEADWDASPDDPANPRSVAAAIAAETPGAWLSRQFDNPSNPLAHFETTGPEIWQQTAGRVTHLVASIGTGGTISGSGRFLKEASAGAVRVIGANPAGSSYGGGPDREIRVDGVGTRWPREWWPRNVDTSVIDEVVTVDDDTVYDVVRRVALEEGLVVGPSSGLAIAVALRQASAADAVVVAISADSGMNYVSKGIW